MKTLISFLVLISLTFLIYPKAQASNIFIEPSAAFGARLIYGQNVIVGSSVKGPNIYDALPIKEGTSDRTCLEFSMAGQATTSDELYLNFLMYNLDTPSYSNLSLYSYTADGVAAAADYFKTDNFITSFTDYGNTQEYKAFSLNVTNLYNQSVSNGIEYLGFNLKAEDTVARYWLKISAMPDDFLHNVITLSVNSLPPEMSIRLPEQGSNRGGVVTPEHVFVTEPMVLDNKVLNMDVWMDIDKDPASGGNSLICDVSAILEGGETTVLGQLEASKDSTDWAIARILVPEELRGQESRLSFVLSGYDPNTKPVAYVSNISVPEPATMLLLGSGLICLAGFRRKFKK